MTTELKIETIHRVLRTKECDGWDDAYDVIEFSRDSTIICVERCDDSQDEAKIISIEKDGRRCSVEDHAETLDIFHEMMPYLRGIGIETVRMAGPGKFICEFETRDFKS